MLTVLGVGAVWGFTVDDAWIIARVAHHWAIGDGHRFNAAGAAVDAVTPLGFPLLLLPAARRSTEAAFELARVVGAASVVTTAAVIAGRVARRGGSRRGWLPVLLWCASLPWLAWASAGLETGLVALGCALAAAPGPAGVLAAGVVGALRPELIPATAILAVGGAWVERERRGRVATRALIWLTPIVAVVLVRQLAFGATYPLAALAKPAELVHGLRYVLGGLALTGLPWLLLAPGVVRGLPRQSQLLLVALGAHAASLLAAGGDWMPLFRLWVPVFPWMVLVAVEIAERAPLRWTLLRGTLALAATLLLHVGLGGPSRRVAGERRALIESARPVLTGARRVAALDVGWVGVAHPGLVVDLAGVTDPSIARLAGGHTTKRVPADLLRTRRVDHVVLLLAPGRKLVWPPQGGQFARGVEQVVAHDAHALGYQPIAELPLGADQRYVVLAEYGARDAASEPR